MDNNTSSTNSTETINCPHCGAVARYPCGAASAQYSYCGQSISIPNAPRVIDLGHIARADGSITPPAKRAQEAWRG